LKGIGLILFPTASTTKEHHWNWSGVRLRSSLADAIGCGLQRMASCCSFRPDGFRRFRGQRKWKVSAPLRSALLREEVEFAEWWGWAEVQQDRIGRKNGTTRSECSTHRNPPPTRESGEGETVGVSAGAWSNTVMVAAVVEPQTGGRKFAIGVGRTSVGGVRSVVAGLEGTNTWLVGCWTGKKAQHAGGGGQGLSDPAGQPAT